MRSIVLVLALCGCTTSAGSDAGRDARVVDDAPAVDAALIDAGEDAGAELETGTELDAPLDAPAPAVDAPTCDPVTVGSSLGLCDDRWLACRVAPDGSTYCGSVSMPPTPGGAECAAETCDRGYQCIRLRGTLSCRRFCDLARGNADCTTGAMECETPVDPLDPEDQPLDFPTGLGLCR